MVTIMVIYYDPPPLYHVNTFHPHCHYHYCCHCQCHYHYNSKGIANCPAFRQLKPNKYPGLSTVPYLGQFMA